MCEDAGVKLVYLPPYLNLIQGFSAELKSFIKRHWSYFEENPDQGIDFFLEWCIDVVGAREESASGHFSTQTGKPRVEAEARRPSRR